MILRILKFLLGIALALVLCVAIYAATAGRPLFRVASGSVSHALCAAEFISRLDADRVYREEELPEGGMGWIDWALHYRIDRERQEVRTTIAGFFATRAIYRDDLGCLLIQGDDVPANTDMPHAPRSANKPDAPLTETGDPALRHALDLAFAEPDASQLRRTKAVVVMHEGRLIAERYAPGYGPDTPIWAHSLSKSLTNALIGILVRQNKLQVSQAAPVAAWQSAQDPHHGITVDQLLRMSSGLPFDETGEAVNPAARMWFLQRDMAAFAEQTPLAHPPGTVWGYSNLSFLILSQLVRDAAGGDAARTRDFVRRELAEPLGMHTLTIDYDATGTPLGAGHTYASARDFARFGQLYLDDGVVDGQRILPQGWAAYSASQTLDTGYGAGFWTNLRNEGSVPYWDAPWGMPQLPKDMFYARGYMGQFVIIIPSEHLVVVRFGLTHNAGTGIGDATAAIITALHKPASDGAR